MDKDCRIKKTERGDNMDERSDILSFLLDVIGEEGCGNSCSEAEVFRDEEGWKMMLEGFMEPWFLGKTAEEAKMCIKEYSTMGFGLS
jgi:hypothetical protein